MTVSVFVKAWPGYPSANQGNRSRADQMLVKDEVVFQEAHDPYRALIEASQRLRDGGSVFFADKEPQQKQGSADRAGIFSTQ